jgi:uracil-DNA glycosylase
MDIKKRINAGWEPFFEINNTELTGILDCIDFDTIYPNKNDIFRSLFYFPPNEIKLVILGQDPYISSENGIPQACGLSFSVPKNHKKIPPSLQNIFKEIKNSYPDYQIPGNGCLKRWVKKEKILLLNSALTVIKGKSNSHAKLWSSFTDNLIRFISENNNDTIFLLMGNFAINKEMLIDNKHKIFKIVHPSPLSAHRGFFGSNIFKEINDYLETKKTQVINW